MIYPSKSIKYNWLVATQRFFIFTPNPGEDEPNLTSIFFKGVGSTTNEIRPQPLMDSDPAVRGARIKNANVGVGVFWRLGGGAPYS